MNLPLPSQPLAIYLIVRTHPVRWIVGVARSEAEAIESVRRLESCSQPGAKYTYTLNPTI
jgi:hypothetical protein